ncbi:MAG: methyltransferase domain-containing protein [Candidatus Dormibacteraeota bacterium]|nr:methyltransferase domain-containing protein [Candidatus Dormibacteraeota bacterium]
MGIARQERYRQEYAQLRPGWRDSLRLYRDLVGGNLPAGGRVLDLGCGHANWLSPELAGAGLAAGLDPDLDALRRNTSHPDRVVGLADHLPFADGSFDLVVNAWVFEHLERPEPAVREMARVLRPGGRLVFLTPNAWNYNVWLIRAVPNRLHDHFTRRLYGRDEHDTYSVRYRLNTARRLRQVLGAAGFRRSRLIVNPDPTYLSFGRHTFALARALERLHDLGPLRRARVHLLGVYEKA